MKTFKYELILTCLVIIISTPPYFIDVSAEKYVPFSIGTFLIVLSLLAKIQFTDFFDQISTYFKINKTYVSALSKINKTQDQIFQSLALREIKYHEQLLEKITNGEVDYSYPLRRELITQSTQLANKFVFVTHYLGKKSLLEMWQSDSVQKKYFDSNIKLVNNGIKFERLFVVNSSMSTEDSKLALQVFEEQKKSGIQVFVLFEDDLHEGWGDDIVIVDRKRLHLYKRGNGATERFERVELIIDPGKIEDYTQEYIRFKLRSLSWPKDKQPIMNKFGF